MCGGDFPLYHVETKLAGKALAERLGIAVPAVLQGSHSRLADFDWSRLPERFVIKPDAGKSTRGVLVMQREQEGFRELLSGEWFRQDDLATLQPRVARALMSPERYPGIFAEEALVSDGRPALDWKLFVFGGRVRLILEIMRLPDGPRYKMYDEHARSAGAIHLRDPMDQSLPPPRHPERLIDAASRIAKALYTPFVRIDLFELDGEIYFGELTLRPGSAHLFNQEWDRTLGEAWEAAEADLMNALDRHGYMP